MRKASLLVAFLGVALVGLATSPPGDELPDVARATLQGRVIRVYDGDTVEVDFGPQHVPRYERVRLLGIDTPELSEPAEYYAREAKGLLTRLVGHRMVRLELVPGNERDGYGRLLAYIYVRRDGDWILVNGELLRLGAGEPLFVGEERYSEYLIQCWIEALANRTGKWGRYPGELTPEQLWEDPQKYVLEGVTVQAHLLEIRESWEGLILLCEAGFRFFIPRERLGEFEQAGLGPEDWSLGVEVLASGVLSWDVLGPYLELWGPAQVHSLAGDPG
ncbi:MAG TPA: hypothetical protein ENI38_03175 [Candidatus Acetothermia bacterium]|nr:hypothetical protein [Candidatus Acetothermia bacterium]